MYCCNQRPEASNPCGSTALRLMSAISCPRDGCGALSVAAWVASLDNYFGVLLCFLQFRGSLYPVDILMYCKLHVWSTFMATMTSFTVVTCSCCLFFVCLFVCFFVCLLFCLFFCLCFCLCSFGVSDDKVFSNYVKGMIWWETWWWRWSRIDNSIAEKDCQTWLHQGQERITVKAWGLLLCQRGHGFVLLQVQDILWLSPDGPNTGT